MKALSFHPFFAKSVKIKKQDLTLRPAQAREDQEARPDPQAR